MNPSPESISIMLLAVAVVGHAVAWWFKSPKEVGSEQAAQLKSISQDLRKQGELAVRHDEVIKHLIQALEKLTGRIDRLEPYLRTTPQGRRAPSGRD